MEESRVAMSRLIWAAWKEKEGKGKGRKRTRCSSQEAKSTKGGREPKCLVYRGRNLCKKGNSALGEFSIEGGYASHTCNR